jgi:hypothetical protein
MFHGKSPCEMAGTERTAGTDVATNSGLTKANVYSERRDTRQKNGAASGFAIVSP